MVYSGLPGGPDGSWVLIDAGTSGCTNRIIEDATERFGDSHPACIIVTHGHFDHVGSLRDLVDHWDVPVYAHLDEFPFLNGSASYPPAHPDAGGGMMTLLSPLYPRGPIDIGESLRPLPDDGTVPGMPGWQWVATPGHSPGHVSLWHPSGERLIAGDAIITTAQESAYAVLTQTPEIHGPPKYFTPDWESAERSVMALAALMPRLVISGHGPPVAGENVPLAIAHLANNFRQIAVPKVVTSGAG